MSSIHDGHRQRMLDRFLECDGKTDGNIIQDHELLEILLFFAIPRVNTNETAHRLLTEFRSIRGVLDASYDKLIHVKGMGPRSAILIRLVSILFRRYAQSENTAKEIRISTNTAIISYLKKLFIGCDTERIYLLLFDGEGVMISCDMLAEGSSSSAVFDIKQCTQKALLKGAEYAMLTHNHINHNAKPSMEDLVTTKKLYNAFDAVGIHLLEHFIICHDQHVPIIGRYSEKLKEL